MRLRRKWRVWPAPSNAMISAGLWHFPEFGIFGARRMTMMGGPGAVVPFRAPLQGLGCCCVDGSQGTALGWYVVPLWG